MYWTWKNTKCGKSKTIISTLKNRPNINFCDSLIKIDKTSHLIEEGILQAEHVVKFYEL